MISLFASGLARRLVVSKTLGLIAGLAGFFTLPYFWPEVNSLFCWGILLWYTTLGGMIGLMGVMDHHPLIKGFKFPAWFRGIFLGSWMNFVLVFFAYDQLETLLSLEFFGSMNSPWYFVLEGAIIGLIIDLLATKYGGEGKEIL